MNTEIQQCSTKFTKTQWNQYIKYFSFLFYIFSIIFVFIVIWINLSKTACSTIWTLENQRLFRTLAIYFGTKKNKKFFFQDYVLSLCPIVCSIKSKNCWTPLFAASKNVSILISHIVFFFFLVRTYIFATKTFEADSILTFLFSHKRFCKL